jgi:hypothetical protein
MFSVTSEMSENKQTTNNNIMSEKQTTREIVMREKCFNNLKIFSYKFSSVLFSSAKFYIKF